MHRYQPPPDEMIHPEWDLGLFLLSQMLEKQGRLARHFQLPPYQHAWETLNRNRLIATELDYSIAEQATLRDQRYEQLNTQQKAAYDIIVSTIGTDPEHAHFFLQGAGGTGKTFLYRALCNHFRAQGQIVLCVASSGIAAELLPGGRTSHSRFQIPLILHESSSTMITGGSQAAELIRSAGLIIWDEVPMQNKYCFEAVHRSLCDIRGNNHLFGGLPAILGGDWAQILPVIRHGNRAAIVRACFQQSFLWSQFRMLTLSINMRLHSNVAGHNQQYATWLSQLSYDPAMCGEISLPEYVRRVSALEDLYERVFPRTELHNHHETFNFWRSRAILTPFNDSVVAINMELLLRFAGENHLFFSEDTADHDGDEGFEMSTENLQQIELAGLPSSRLNLKLGVPVMLLRNIDFSSGLNNGSRMILTRIGTYTLQGRLLGGDHDGELHVIPRIPLTSIEGELPFTLTRRQFPVRVCFAMTINKSQGQSLNTVGLDLRLPVFCHGQLYVALSRVTDVAKMTVLLPEGSDKTTNIVYPEVLDSVGVGSVGVGSVGVGSVGVGLVGARPAGMRPAEEYDEFGSEPDFGLIE